MLFPAAATGLILCCCCALQMAQANVLFQFSLNFRVKENENADEPINKTIIVENNQLSVQGSEEQSTSAPQWNGTDQSKELAVQKLAETKAAVQQLNVELLPLVGRSDDLAARMKQSMHYVNQVDAAIESGDFAKQLAQLRSYGTLVNALRAPSSMGGERTLEFVLLKLAMEKYGLLRLQDEVVGTERAWTRYQRANVVLSES